MRGLTARSSTADKAVTQQKRKMKKGSKPERSGVAGREREEEEEGCSGGGEKYVHCALLGDGMVGKTCLTLSYTQHVFTDRYTATVFDNYPVPVTVGGEQFTLSLFDTAGQQDYESLRAYTYQSSEVLVLCFSVCERESFYSVVNCWLPEIQRHIKGKRPLLLVGTQIDLRTSPSSPSTDLRTSSSSSSDFRTPSCTSSDHRKTSTSSSNLGTPSCFSYADFGASEFRSSSPTSSSTPSSPAFSSTPSSPAFSSTPSSPAFSSSPRDSLSSISSSFSDLRSFSSSFSSSGQDEVSTEEGSQLAKMIGADCYIECSARSEEGVRQVFEHVVCSALKYRKKKSKILGRLFFKEKPLSDKALQRAASTLNIPVSKLEDPR